MQVIDKNSKRLILERLDYASDRKSRLVGLIGKKKLPQGFGLFIPGCNSIHTCFMPFAIDIIYIDKNKKVIKTVSNVKPWRLSLCLGAAGVVETRSGCLKEKNISKGMVLEFRESGEIK